MLVLTLICLAAAAAVGAILLFKRMGDSPLPVSLAVLHGALAALGVFFLFTAVSNGAGALPIIALIVALLSALGGFYLVSFHARGKKLPMAPAFGHATFSLAAVIILLVRILYY